MVQQLPPQKQYDIAVLDFLKMDDEDNEVGNIEDTVAETLVNLERQKIQVVAQRYVEAILKRMSFELTDLFRGERRTELGKFLSANSLMIGATKRIANNYYLSLALIDVEDASLIASYSNYQCEDLLGGVEKALSTSPTISDGSSVIVIDVTNDRKGNARLADRMLEYEVQFIADRARRSSGIDFTIPTSFYYDEILDQHKLTRTDFYRFDQIPELGRFISASHALLLIPSASRITIQLVNMTSLKLEGSATLDDYPKHPVLLTDSEIKRPLLKFALGTGGVFVGILSWTGNTVLALVKAAATPVTVVADYVVDFPFSISQGWDDGWETAKTFYEDRGLAVPGFLGLVGGLVGGAQGQESHEIMPNFGGMLVGMALGFGLPIIGSGLYSFFSTPFLTQYDLTKGMWRDYWL